jgi:hypothetical protein
MRTADTIAQQAEAVTSQRTPKPRNGDPREAKIARVAPYQWPKGVSGNPNGARKSDIARRLAKKIFELNEAEAYRALAKALLKGNAYVFKELAERAYGKLTETVEIKNTEEIVLRLANGRKRLEEAVLEGKLEGVEK